MSNPKEKNILGNCDRETWQWVILDKQTKNRAIGNPQ